jgi:biopolymer transport protein ExbD
MGMSTGGSSSEGATPHINVTPLIDVLLVLLIIFMVITPVKPSRFEVAINRDTRGLALNNIPMGSIDDPSPLTNRLLEEFKTRENTGAFREGTNEVEKTLFIKSPTSVKYGDVVKVIDAVKIAGASPVGLQIDDLTN